MGSLSILFVFLSYGVKCLLQASLVQVCTVSMFKVILIYIYRSLYTATTKNVYCYTPSNLYKNALLSFYEKSNQNTTVENHKITSFVNYSFVLSRRLLHFYSVRFYLQQNTILTNPPPNISMNQEKWRTFHLE